MHDQTQSPVYRLNSFTDAKEKTATFNLYQASMEFQQAYPDTFFSIQLGSVMTYDNGIYRILSQMELNALILNFLISNGYEYNRTSQVDGVRNTLFMFDSFRKDVKFDSNPYMFATRNVIIDVTNGYVQIKSFSPDFYLTNRYDVEYDSSATCTLFTKTLSEILPENDKQLFLEKIMAYALLKTAEYQKLFLMYGSGRNGKDLIFSTLKAIVGDKNYSTLTSHAITTDKHIVSHLEGKNFNISSEERIGYLSMSTYKELTGGSLITSNPKFRNAHTFTNTAKFIINANELPNLTEMNTSVRERFLIMEFNQTFTGADVDTSLSSRLSTEQEKSGLLNLLLSTMPAIFNNGAIWFDAPAVIKTETARGLNNMTESGTFITSQLNKTENRKDIVTVSELYDAYLTFCAENNIKPISKIRLNKDVEALLNLKTENGNGNKKVYRSLKLN
jgi:putative DNA primase/helicase